MTPQQIKEA